ncbi:MAG: hypothetical protein Q9225_001589 [Loekoesia sp. 1 TL-2023]
MNADNEGSSELTPQVLASRQPLWLCEPGFNSKPGHEQSPLTAEGQTWVRSGNDPGALTADVPSGPTLALSPASAALQIFISTGHFARD